MDLLWKIALKKKPKHLIMYFVPISRVLRLQEENKFSNLPGTKPLTRPNPTATLDSFFHKHNQQ